MPLVCFGALEETLVNPAILDVYLGLRTTSSCLISMVILTNHLQTKSFAMYICPRGWMPLTYTNQASQLSQKPWNIAGWDDWILDDLW